MLKFTKKLGMTGLMLALCPSFMMAGSSGQMSQVPSVQPQAEIPSADKLTDYLIPSSGEANQLNTQYWSLSVVVLKILDSKITLCSAETKLAATLSYNGKVISSAAVNKEDQVEFEPAAPGITPEDDSFTSGFGRVGFYFIKQNDKEQLYKQAGEYVLRIPEGFLLYDGAPIPAFEVKYTWSNDVNASFNYELNPPSGSVVENFEGIVLTFPEASYVEYSENVGKLISEDGSVVLECSYPSMDTEAKTFTFDFFSDEWKDGNYTFYVNPNTIVIDNPSWQYGQDGNFPGLQATYTLKYKAPENVADHISYVIPSSPEANRDNTLTEWGQTGMGVIALGFDSSAVEAVMYADWALLWYTPESGTEEFLSAINLSNEVQSRWTLPEATYSEEEPGLAPKKILTMICCHNGDGGIDEEMLLLYLKDGQYRLDIPNNSLSLDGRNLLGTSVIYNYKNDTVEVKEVSDASVATSFDVYSVDGSCILTQASAEALQTLMPGLYIINGKKVLVR